VIEPAETPSSATPPAAVSSPGPSTDRYRIDPILIGLALLAGIAAAIGAVRALSGPGTESRPIAPAIGAIIGFVFLPFLISWAAFRLTSRSRRAANVTFTIVLFLGFAAYATRSRGPVVGTVPGSSNPTSLAEIRAITEEARKASLDGDEERALQLTAESANKLDEAAASAQGSEKIVMEYAANLARAQNQVLTQYITAAGKYSGDGGGGLTGLSDTASIENRLALLNSAVSTHDDVLAYFRTISDRIPRELAAKGVAKSDADEFLAGFVANAKIENLLAIHAAEHGMLLAARKRFDLLKANPGVWNVSPQGDLVATPGFPEVALAEFNRLQSEIDRLAEKQGLLIEERKAGR
jgi:hypothetical protein